MANTGNLIILTLQQVASPCPAPWTGCDCAPGCPTKPNVPTDPNYEPTVQNLDLCPITYTTTCPSVVATGENDSIEFEFALLTSVVNNPALAKVKIKAMITTVEHGSVTFVLPGTSGNYFSGIITGLADATAYTIEIDYLDDADAVVANCPSITTVTTT